MYLQQQQIRVVSPLFLPAHIDTFVSLTGAAGFFDSFANSFS